MELVKKKRIKNPQVARNVMFRRLLTLPACTGRMSPLGALDGEGKKTPNALLQPLIGAITLHQELMLRFSLGFVPRTGGRLSHQPRRSQRGFLVSHNVHIIATHPDSETHFRENLSVTSREWTRRGEVATVSRNILILLFIL